MVADHQGCRHQGAVMLERTSRTARPGLPAHGAPRKPLIIRRVDAIPVALPLTAPMKMAGVTIATAQNILVRIEAADGTVGWGEAASAPTMTGDTLGGLACAVRDHLAPLLAGQDAWAHADLRSAMTRALMGNSGAHSAVEMALLDLCGRAADVPLIDLIGKPVRHDVAPMWLLGNATPDEDIAEARTKQKQGFNFFKLKIGVKPLAAEIAAAHDIRAALPDIPLCADANCGLTLAAARRYIAGTRAAKLMFVEQPLAYDDLAGLKVLARGSTTPIGIDEGIHSLADIEANARAGAGGVSLKLIKLGGITQALAAGKLCRKLGLKINVATKIAESSIGTSATVHLACAAPNVAWGVSLTNLYLAEDLVRRPITVSSGKVALPDQPGLGVEVDESAVARYRVH
jgi:muconate cycloisomerase